MKLAPYAVIEPCWAEREYEQSTHPFRSEFQRDRDRIVHSKAFRRLEYKTQVFVNHLGDNFRTRLTHSIEVSQISRTLARTLQVNEDLTETLALAHDLGHPPFGHAGERALHQIMRSHGGFDHNQQSLRIITELEERYPEHRGLNLTKATLRGLRKHESLPENEGHSIEAQIVDLCDEIAYNNHDLEDGLESGLITLKQLESVELWAEEWHNTLKLYPEIDEKVQIRYTIRSLINRMVKELVEDTQRRIEKAGITDFNDVVAYSPRESGVRLAGYRSDFSLKVSRLKKFLFRNLYRHPEIVRMNTRSEKMIYRLFEFLTEAPGAMPEEYRRRVEEDGLYRSICDFIAGMTDRYAAHWNRDVIGSS